MTKEELRKEYCNEFGYSEFNRFNKGQYVIWLESKLESTPTEESTSGDVECEHNWKETKHTRKGVLIRHYKKCDKCLKKEIII